MNVIKWNRVQPNSTNSEQHFLLWETFIEQNGGLLVFCPLENWTSKWVFQCLVFTPTVFKPILYLDVHCNYLFLGHTVEFRDESQTAFRTNHALQQKMTSQKYPIKVGIWIVEIVVQSRLVDKWFGFWMVQNLDKSWFWMFLALYLKYMLLLFSVLFCSSKENYHVFQDYKTAGYYQILSNRY